MLDIAAVRAMFPALANPLVYLENPAGTQIARQSLDRVHDYLINANANVGGPSAPSRSTNALLHEARRAMADFLNAARPEEIVFGANMTTLTFSIARHLAEQDLTKGDTVVITQMDHDANCAPWVRAARNAECTLKIVDFRPETGMFDDDSLDAALAAKPKLVAIGYASNVLGTINPVREITARAKAVGATVYVDAVQYAPHGLIDVQDIGCDFLACSAYKFFGPHVGILYGKHDQLERLNAIRVRPAANVTPQRFEIGTQNHEGIAGTLGAVEHYEDIARLADPAGADGATRRERIVRAFDVIGQYEDTLARLLLERLQSVPGLTVYGITDPDRFHHRLSTFSFRIGDHAPRDIATYLAERAINVSHGNVYGINVTERLGIEEKGGIVRVGLTHYNTAAEVDALAEALTAFAAS